MTGAAQRGRAIALCGVLLGANLAVWTLALLSFRQHPLLLSAAMLAYTLGLRHAVDADHIAAIDNATRKLVQQGERPLGVGLYFALGHSTVVVLLSLGVGLASAELTTRFEGLKQVGSLIGTTASAAFLLFLALFNLALLLPIWRRLRAVRRGEAMDDTDFDILLNSRGLLSRLFRPLFRFVSRSWHVYPIGFLFGLGFDTATEVALLGLSAVQAADGLPIASLLIFPALFTAGMTLLDTADGLLMLYAYGWAQENPMRKLYYNLTITAASVVVALGIGGIEALGLIGDRLALGGWFWEAVGAMNDHLEFLGFAMIGFFALLWIGFATLHRLRGYAGVSRPASPLM